jgi:uncharacterized protein YjbI with pentapeptide repeats
LFLGLLPLTARLEPDLPGSRRKGFLAMGTWPYLGWAIAIAAVGLMVAGLLLLDAKRTRIPWLVDWPRWAVAVLGMAACLLVVLLIFFFVLMLPFTGVPGSLLFWRLEPYIEPQNATEKAALVQAQIQAAAVLVQVFGGGFLIATLFYTLRTVRLTQEGNQLTREQIRVSQEGQITDRFSRAIDQLGNESLEIRLGGIYALERIARDSPTDYGPVMEVLTAYVREHAQIPPMPDDLSILKPAGSPEAFVEELLDRYHINPILPRTDIQAALTVLGRRQVPENNEDWPLNLARTYLVGAQLDGAHLAGADLTAAHLDRASFTNAHLEKTKFLSSRLQEAAFQRAHLEHAVLNHANLQGAFLIRAHLEDAAIDTANLQGARLGEACLQRASLAESHLEGAYLEHANLEGADLNRAHLEGAKLIGARLEGAHLFMAHLEGTDLRSVEGLTQAQIDEAYMDETTQLPSEPGSDGKPLERSKREK